MPTIDVCAAPWNLLGPHRLAEEAGGTEGQ
jgi:hypothetical protein